MNANTSTSGGLFGSLGTATPSTISFGSTTATTQPSFGLGGLGVKPATANLPTFGTPASSAPSNVFGSLGTAGFNLGGTVASTLSSTEPAATQSSGFSLSGTTGTSLGLTLGATVAPASTPSTGLVPNAAGDANTRSVNFAQMDEAIQKWTLELVEQEKVFLNQIDQVRDWDRLLLSTGDKISTLNDGMQKVKLRQQQLDHELDFIVAQQRELAECLEPLEKEFGKISVSDPERDSVYQRAENLNSQLQRISEDLKGVIEHINEKNRTHDTSDPIVQIGRILNAHMNSLQWVDQNTSVIQQMLDQISKMRDVHRRDADSTQNL